MANPNTTVKRWRRRQSDCIYEHVCNENYTAQKYAAFLRAGAKQGNYFVRVVAHRRSFRGRHVAPWNRSYYWTVRAYRKFAY